MSRFQKWLIAAFLLTAALVGTAGMTISSWIQTQNTKSVVDAYVQKIDELESRVTELKYEIYMEGTGS